LYLFVHISSISYFFINLLFILFSPTTPVTVLRFLDGHKHLNFVTLEIEPPNSIKFCVFFENMADFSVYFAVLALERL